MTIRGEKYLTVTNAAKLLSVGDPGAGGLNLFTSSKSLSMNIESPKFPGTGSNSIIYLYSGSSADSRIEFTRTSWLGYGLFVYKQLNAPIRHNVFSLSYWGVYASEGNDLFNNLVHENTYGAYASGNAQVANCTFDRNDTGLEVFAADEEVLHIRDSLFTANADEGIFIESSAGDIVNYYNAFWNNGEEIDGGQVGPGSQELSQSPYHAGIEGGWELHYKLKQDEGWPFTDSPINAGSCWAPDPVDGPHPYSTCDYAKRDVGRIDIGFHFTFYENSDGDHLPDAWETHYFEDLDEADDSTNDDDDGLTALQEFWHGSSPELANTDQDAYNDVDEVGVQQEKLLRGWGPAVYDFKAGPWLTNATDEEITIGWWVGSASTRRIYYREETESEFTEVQDIDARNGTIEGTVYEGRLSGLSPDTAYQYYVKCTISKTVRTSPLCKFRTLESDPSSFTFIVYGDNRGENESGKYNNNGFNEYAADVVRAMLPNVSEAQFVLHVGDYVNDDDNAEHWRQHFFLPATRLIAECPVFPALGNHEDEDGLKYFDDFFDYPDDPNDPDGLVVYYGFGYGGWYFICLDTNDPSTFNEAGDPQREWLSDVLGDEEEASGKPIVVWFHQPPFSTSRRGGDGAVRDHLVPIFEDEDNDVRVVFNGHDHFYECLEEEGITYVITGGAGAPLNKDPWHHQNEPNGATCLAREAWFHYCIVEVSPGGIGFTAIHDSGVPMDVFEQAERVETFGLGDGEEWYYNDSGQNLGTEWKEPDYSHSWSSADAPLGFGEGQTPQLQDDYVTYYFRKEGVDINGFAEAEQIAIKVHCDDGCVVYVNGVEAFRHNIAVGPVDYLTEAPYTIGTEDWQEYLRTVNRYIVPRELFGAEDNVIAIEVHQCLPTSSDLNIDVGVWTWY